MWGLWRYYDAFIQLGKLEGTFLPQETFYSAGYLWQFLGELSILWIHPIPFVQFEIHVPEVFGYSLYNSDDLFTVLMLPRVYLFYRLFRDELKLIHETILYHGKLCGVELLDLKVVMKQLILEFPWHTIPAMYFMTVMLFSYMMKCFERPTNTDFHYFSNAGWCALITMAMTGYGDMYPCTTFGRIVAVAICGMALLCYTLLIIGVRNTMQFTDKELICFFLLRRKMWRDGLKEHAAIVIQSSWRSVASLERGNLSRIGTLHRDVKLFRDIRTFRAARKLEPIEKKNLGTTLWNLYKALGEIDESLDGLNLEVQIAKQGAADRRARI